jgi:hypothetical protein
MEGWTMTLDLTWNDNAPKRQLNADGSVEFVCTDCGADVFCAVDDGFDFPVCFECRFFGERPQLQRLEQRR